MPGSRSSPSAYRLFRHPRAPGLCCAVDEAARVPDFVRVGAWTDAIPVREDGSLPFGFRPAPAREAIAAFGFYLFHHPCEDYGARSSRRWP